MNDQDLDGKQGKLERGSDRARQPRREERENEERWQLLLQGGDDGIWDWNPRAPTLFLSSRWKEMLGYSDEELANHFDTWKSLLHPDDRERVLERLRAYLAREIPEYRVEFRLRCRDGSYKWILARGQALWDETGQPLRVAGSHTDIDERERRERSLEIQVERDNLLTRIVRSLIENDLDRAVGETLEKIGTFTGSGRSYIIRYSPCRQQWSMAYEWCDRRHLDIVPILEESQDLPIETFPWFSEQLSNGIPIRVNSLEDLPPTAVAERRVLMESPVPRVLVVPMMDGSGETVGYLGLDAFPGRQWTREDVNFARLIGELIAIAQARQVAENRLKEAKEAADRANRAKSEFLAHMSHELRTPLNAILGFTRLIARDDGLGREQKEYLNIVNRSGEHLLELIDEILEMSKIEVGRTSLNPRAFALENFLSDIEEMLRPQARSKGLTLIFEVTPGLPPYLYGDENKLRQILINILGNGIKFTASGGVSLRVRAAPENGLYRLFFEIEDTGPGISPEDIPRLFDPFVQTETGRQSRQGTGLGLPISQKFVGLMGGTLRVSSSLGRGSVFAFDILMAPATVEDSGSSHPARKVSGLQPDQPKYRILVVEDRPESRLLLTTLLSSLGLATRQGTNGHEAIEIWREWHPHLIWMDMRMPVMDGYSATREIRRLEGGDKRETVIIALTASAFEEDRAGVIEAGCDDFVRKPFKEEVIWQKMTEYLGVSYIFADETNAHPTAGAIALESLTSDLALLDRDWLARLRQAALECNDERVIELTASIPPERAGLALGLQQLAGRFLFDTIERALEDLNIF